MAIQNWRIFEGLQAWGDGIVDVQYDDVTNVIQDLLATAVVADGQTLPPNLQAVVTITRAKPPGAGRSRTAVLTPGTPLNVSALNLPLTTAEAQTARGGAYSISVAWQW